MVSLCKKGIIVKSITLYNNYIISKSSICVTSNIFHSIYTNVLKRHPRKALYIDCFHSFVCKWQKLEQPQFPLLKNGKQNWHKHLHDIRWVYIFEYRAVKRHERMLYVIRWKKLNWKSKVHVIPYWERWASRVLRMFEAVRPVWKALTIKQMSLFIEHRPPRVGLMKGMFFMIDMCQYCQCSSANALFQLW